MSPVSTTSLKLPEEIKLQAANAAKDLGITPHAFMVEAIKQAIKDGNYPVNPRRIAESFVALEKLITN